MSTKSIPLGYRFNNPGNIRCSNKNKWLGQTGQFSGFCKFDDVEYGIRAMLIILRKYVLVHKIVKVYDIIKRYAPASENDVDAYFRYVNDCFDLYSFDEGKDEFEITNYIALCNLAFYMSCYEVGVIFAPSKNVFYSVYRKYLKKF